MRPVLSYAASPLHIFTAAVLGLILSCATPALAAEKTGAMGFVESLGQKAITSLIGENITLPVREARVRELFKGYFDIQTIGKFAMGRYWRDATPVQKKEYMSLFETMVVKTYAQRFEQYSGQVLVVKGEMKSGDKDIIVNAELKQEGGPPVNVDWRVRKQDGGYKIIDVIVEGISMSVTQRSDFAAVIQKNGGSIDALIATLRDRSTKNGGDTGKVAKK